jgi:hypothetical protein
MKHEFRKNKTETKRITTKRLALTRQTGVAPRGEHPDKRDR